MQPCTFAAIDPVATGRNILNLRKERNLSVKDIQRYFHFEEPRAIYKWQSGQSLPNIDNLYALSALFDVPMDAIIVGNKKRIISVEPQERTCGSDFFSFAILRRQGRARSCPLHTNNAQKHIPAALAPRAIIKRMEHQTRRNGSFKLRALSLSMSGRRPSFPGPTSAQSSSSSKLKALLTPHEKEGKSS